MGRFVIYREMARLRWGILSTAKIADALVRAIKATTNCELAAVASRDAARAQAWARERNIPHAFGGYEEMLASDIVDAVYICLPNGLHKEWSLRAAAQHKHVLCEKPLASNAGEVEEMIRAAKANHVLLMEAFMYRFHPQIRRVQELIADGSVGDLKMVRATFGYTQDRPGDIRWRPELAGGALMDVGCYCVNISRLIMRREPIAARAAAVWAPSGVDESLSGILEFPGGAMGLVDCSFKTYSRQWAGVSGTRGQLSLPEPFRIGNREATIYYDQAGVTEVLEAPGADEYQQMVAHFADAVLEGKALSYPPEDSLNQMRVIDGLYLSARNGCRVELKG